MGVLSLGVPVDPVSHDVVEVVGGDETVVVQIGASEHSQELLFGDFLSEVLADPLQFVDGELLLT